MLDGLRVVMAPSRGEEPAPYDVRDQLSSIAVPTLVLVGRHDPVCSVRWATALHDGIPNAELTIFENSGQFAHVEEPEMLAEVVLEWIRAHGANADEATRNGACA